MEQEDLYFKHRSRPQQEASFQSWFDKKIPLKPQRKDYADPHPRWLPIAH